MTMPSSSSMMEQLSRPDVCQPSSEFYSQKQQLLQSPGYRRSIWPVVSMTFAVSDRSRRFWGWRWMSLLLLKVPQEVVVLLELLLVLLWLQQSLEWAMGIGAGVCTDWRLAPC